MLFPPIPGRECGNCSVCCDLPSIDVLRKPPRILCEHRDNEGCRIYGERPSACRDFFCGWRVLAKMDDGWRPDRCEILVELRPDCVPEQYAELGYVFRFTLFGALDKIFWNPFVTLVGGLVSQDFPVFLAVAGKPGHAGGQYFLTEALKPVVPTHDYARMVGVLAQALQVCIDHPQTNLARDN